MGLSHVVPGFIGTVQWTGSFLDVETGSDRKTSTYTVPWSVWLFAYIVCLWCPCGCTLTVIICR